MTKLVPYIIALLLPLSALAQVQDKTPLFLEAVAEYAEQQVDSAYAKLLRLHEETPEDDAVNYYLGLCEYSLEKPDEAEFHLMEAIRLDTSNVWYKHTLTSFYGAIGNKAGLARMGEEMVRIKPSSYNNPYTLTTIADAIFSQRQAAKALEYYDKALEIDPEYLPARFGKMETFYAQGNYPPFFVLLGQFIDHPEVRPDIKVAYLEAFLENMDSEVYWVWGKRLEELVDICIDKHPEEFEANNLKITLLYIREDWAALLAHCDAMAKRAISLGNNEAVAEAYATKGDVEYQEGDRRAAFKSYKKALKYNPDYAPTLNNYAYYLSEEGRSLGKAEQMSARTVELEPDNATYRDTYGWILYLLGRPQEAKPHFKHAMIYGGRDSSVVLEHYAIVLEALGETELAKYYRGLAEIRKEQGK